jgi:hypothetical protein
VSDPRAQHVGAGYDAMVETWEEWNARITRDPRAEWLAELVSRLPEGPRVVELGCGGGTPEIRAPDGDAAFQWVLARR